MGKIVLGVAFALTAWLGMPGSPEAAEAAETAVTEAPEKGQCTPAEKCCKVCDTGWACGNACIAKNKHCKKPRGCACNQYQVCGADP